MYYQSKHGGCFPYKDKCSDRFSSACLINFYDNTTMYGETGVTYVFDDRLTFLRISMSNNKKVTAKDTGYYSMSHNLYTDCTREELRNYSKKESYFVSKCKSLNELQCTYRCAKCFKTHKFVSMS